MAGDNGDKSDPIDDAIKVQGTAPKMVTSQIQLGSGKTVMMAFPADMNTVDFVWVIKAVTEFFDRIVDKQMESALVVPSKQILVPKQN